MSTPDPLSPKSLPGPGLRQWLREAFTGRPTPLLCMQVEVSSVCACRCTYCPHTTKKDVWQSRLMSAETFAALWPLMRQCGRVHLQGWGEPFLHPRFMDFVGVARRAGCAVSTTTCGQHMDESLAAAIVDSGMDVVAFSLAGTDEASNASRQGIPFSRVCEAIRCLREVRRKKQGVHLEVHLAYLLLPSQLEAVKRLPELMEELDVHCAVVSTMDYIASPELAAEAYSPEEADKVAAAAAVLAPVAARVRQSGRELWYALPDPEAVGRVRNGCRENVDRTIYVDTQGNLSPCVYVNLPTSEDDPKRRIFARAEYGRPAGELAEQIAAQWAELAVLPEIVFVSDPAALEALEQARASLPWWSEELLLPVLAAAPDRETAEAMIQNSGLEAVAWYDTEAATDLIARMLLNSADLRYVGQGAEIQPDEQSFVIPYQLMTP